MSDESKTGDGQMSMDLRNLGSAYAETLATIQTHRDLVRSAMEIIAGVLSHRGLIHDLSKLRPDELGGFVRLAAATRGLEYGTLEHARASRANRSVIELHHSRNSHHPEFYTEDPVDQAMLGDEAVHRMGWLDVIEMVCDWWAANQSYGDPEDRPSFEDVVAMKANGHQWTEGQWWLVEQVAEFLSGGEDDGREG